MIILDGGTGTLIQALGAPMHGDTWCADANLTHPDIVRQAHRQYLDAGAEVLIANTYATSPLLFNHLGRDDDVALIDARKGLAMFRKVNVPVLGMIENMSYYICRHCGEREEIFGHGGGRRTAEMLGVPFLGEIPLDPKVVVGGDTGEPIVVLEPGA